MRYFGRIYKTILPIAFLLLIISCQKEITDPILQLPSIAFVNNSDYIQKDTTINKNTFFKTSIAASKKESADILTRFTITSNYDYGTDSIIYSKTLSGSESENFTYNFNFTTRNKTGIEKYTFSIFNKNSVANKISFTLTVN